MRPSIVHAYEGKCGKARRAGWHASCVVKGMNLSLATLKEVPMEDWVDKLSRLTLVLLLLATLGCIVA
jgi:hypothetical protein